MAQNNIVIATVVSIDDPTYSGRIKVRVPGFHDSIVNDDLLPIFQKILGDNEVISKESISEMMKNKDVICYSLSNSKNYLVFFCCKNVKYLEKIKKLRKINDGLFYVYVTINNVAEVNLSFYKIFEVDMLRTFFNK